jgi:hypothetical protein
LEARERPETAEVPEEVWSALEKYREEAISCEEESQAAARALQAQKGELVQSEERAGEGLDAPVGRVEASGPQPEPPLKVVSTAPDVPTTIEREATPSSEPGDHIGGYVLSERQIPVTEAGAPPKPEPKLETDGLHRIPAEAEVELEAEPRTLEAVDYGKGVVLRAPKTDLEEAGADLEAGQNAILKLGLKDVKTEEVEPVFARYVASDRRAEAYVGDIGGEEGSRYELVEAEKYDEDGFVKDFERGKCEHLQNARLERIEDKMFVEVDNRRIELQDYRLATSGSHVVMKGKLEGESDCKFEFDGRRASVRFGRDYPVEGMRMEGDDLVVKYAQSKNEKHEHRLHLEHLEAPERPSLSQYGRPEMLEHVKALDHPERVEGLYQFVLDRAVQTEIRRLLDKEERIAGENARDKLKGDIGEILTANLLELSGWERIKRHPFNDNRKEGVSANGPDWLILTPNQKQVIMETKWWNDSTRAEARASLQVEKDFEHKSKRQELGIVGAYVAIIDWKIDDNPMKIYVKHVIPKEELK